MAATDRLAALEDFRDARRQAALERLLARLTGKSAELLSYSEVREKLRVTGSRDRGLHQIPIKAIVGSVGRFQDYTRRFQPKHDADEQRWANVKAAMMGMTGVPPIEVFKVGDAYFVKDGNHRVSIARQIGMPTISAYVTEVSTRVPLSPDDDADALILKSRYANFLERSNLDRLRPGADMQMTVPGHYSTLLEHIEVHHYYMHIDQQRADIPYYDGVTSWYDNVFRPLVDLIVEMGLDHVFPEYTRADLYILVSEYYASLAEQLGWRISTEAAIAKFAEQRRGRLEKESDIDPQLSSAVNRNMRARGQVASQHLFRDILVAGEGVEEELPTLVHALTVAQREQGTLLGLHVTRRAQELDMAAAERVIAAFERACRAADVEGQVAVAVGAIADIIVERASYVDLIVLRLARPAGPTATRRIAPAIRSIIERSPRPLLAVPDGAHSDLNRLLLAFDGSAKAQEALSVAAYLHGCWNATELVVVTAGALATAAPVLEQARNYLKPMGISAQYVAQDLSVGRAILETAVQHQSNLLIMGGFGYQPALRMLLGSTVDGMLREFAQPILICR